LSTAPLRPCSAGCGALVVRGRCAACSRHREQQRGTATQRGYGAAWLRFRPRFLAALVEAGILPVCGAALPDGPQTNDSACKAAGRLTFRSDDGSSLHFDHDPPLQEHERGRPDAVCDVRRVQLLCASCHARKDAPPGARGGPEMDHEAPRTNR